MSEFGEADPLLIAKGLDVGPQTPAKLPMAGSTGHKAETYGGGGTRYSQEVDRERVGKTPNIASGESTPFVPSVPDQRLRGRVAEKGGGGGSPTQFDDLMEQLRDIAGRLEDKPVANVLDIVQGNPKVKEPGFKQVTSEGFDYFRTKGPNSWRLIYRIPFSVILGLVGIKSPKTWNNNNPD